MFSLAAGKTCFLLPNPKLNNILVSFLLSQLFSISLSALLVSCWVGYFHCLGSYPRVTLREICKVSIGVPQTRKSLVKGERFIRFVWRTWVWQDTLGNTEDRTQILCCLCRSRYFDILCSLSVVQLRCIEYKIS